MTRDRFAGVRGERMPAATAECRQPAVAFGRHESRDVCHSIASAGFGPCADGAVAVGEIIGSGEHRDHAPRASGGVDANRPDARVRVGRADEPRRARSGHADIIGVTAGARDEALVLETRERDADVLMQSPIFHPAKDRERALFRTARRLRVIRRIIRERKAVAHAGIRRRSRRLFRNALDRIDLVHRHDVIVFAVVEAERFVDRGGFIEHGVHLRAWNEAPAPAPSRVMPRIACMPPKQKPKMPNLPFHRERS